jgi:ribosomal-protein-alanine N-acetyltransferase
MRTATRFFVRSMRIADIPQVLEVERESFPSMWPPTAFKRELQQNRLAHYIVVVEHDPSRQPAVPSEEPEADRPPTGVGKLWGEIRHFLGVDETSVGLPPIEQRPELIIGFIGVWMLPDEAHIVTVAVRDSHRRKGIGELLLISAIELAQAKEQALVTLECRVTNEPALALYEKYGFEQVGLRPRYYSDNHEDAYVLTVSSVLTERFQRLFDRLKAEHADRFGHFESALR